MKQKTKVADNKTDLRRGIDHIGVSASFIVHDGNGNILLQKRGPKASDEQGAWDIGGGAIEFGESIDETVRREVMEELCSQAIDIKFLTVYDAHREYEDKRTHWIAIIYSVKINPSDVKIGEPDKIDELGWFTSNNLPTPLHSQFHKSFDVAVDKGIIV
jgi:8-oxo-dGTP diphosphatase